MQTPAVSIVVLSMLLSLPASAAKLVEAPPPPPMPEGLPDEDVAPPRPAAAGTVGRGQVLYETGCTACHESVAQIGARKAVQSLADLREQTARRAGDAKLRWSKEELEAVVLFLNSRHYRFQP